MACRPAVITVRRPGGNYYSVISDTNKQKTQNGLYTKSIQKPDKIKLITESVSGTCQWKTRCQNVCCWSTIL